MEKEYEYYGTINAKDDEDVTITVVLPDKGTETCATWIATPHGNKPIQNEGSCVIGKGNELKNIETEIVSSPMNIEPKIDVIRLNIFANGQLIAEHSNPKSESKLPAVYVYLTVK